MYKYANLPIVVGSNNNNTSSTQYLYRSSVTPKSVNDRTYRSKTEKTSIYSVPDPIELQKRRDDISRADIEHKRALKYPKPPSPPPVGGRVHCYIQTDLYLEELSDRAEEKNTASQTEDWIFRPFKTAYIAQKSGVDVETQIMEGDLFDFKREVKPIIEVLIKKTIEQSLLEVMEEEELANIREQQRIFEELRNAELHEQQRLEEHHRRLRSEKERAMCSMRFQKEKEAETKAKLAAGIYSQYYLKDLVPSAFSKLSISGYLYDPVERDIQEYFLTGFHKYVDSHVTIAHLSKVLLDDMIRNVVDGRKKSYADMERDQAEWKMVDKAFVSLHDKTSQTAVYDIGDSYEEICHVAENSATLALEFLCRDIIAKGVDQFALEEASAYAATIAAEEAVEDI